MLDANELKRRLIDAMDTHSPRITSADLARACKVTPQAVNGWRKTGRIAKGKIEKIAELTERPLEYFLSAAPTPAPKHAPIEEALAIKALRDAMPEWRNYVLGLATIDDHETQALLLRTMRNAVPDSRVEEHIAIAPHAAVRGLKKK